MTIDQLTKLRSSLVADRQQITGIWRAVGEFVEPKRSFTDGMPHANFSLDPELADTKLTRALRTNAAGQFEMTTPRLVRWFSLEPPNMNAQVGKAAEAELVKEFDATAMLAMDLFANSNFHQEASRFLFERAAYGQAAMWVERDDTTMSVKFKNLYNGEWYVQRNDFGDVRYFMLDRYYTAVDLLDLYGNEPAWSKELIEKAKNFNISDKYLVFCVLVRKQDGGWNMFHVFDEGKMVLKVAYFATLPVVVCNFDDRPGSSYGYGLGELCLPDQRELNGAAMLLKAGAEGEIYPPMLVPHGMKDDIGLGAGEITYFNPNLPNAIPRILGNKGSNAHALLELSIKRLENAIDDNTDQKLFAPLASVQNVQNMKATVANILESYSAKVSSPQYTRLVKEFLEPCVRRVVAALVKFNLVAEVIESTGRYTFVTPFQISLNYGRKQVVEDFLNLLVPIAQFDPAVTQIFNAERAGFDLGRALGMPPTWLRSPDEMRKVREQQQQQQQAMMAEQNALNSSQVMLNSARAQQLQNG